MKNDFIPDREPALIMLEKNFLEKFESYAAILELHTTDITQTISILENHTECYRDMISKKAETKSAVEKNLLGKNKALKELRRIAKLMKSSRNYTPVIGDALGIIGPEIQVKTSSDLKPVLKTSISAGEVIIKYRKERTHGIVIYSKRGDEKEFTIIARNSISPFIDTRKKLDKSKPEQREYYAMFLNNFNETGVPSNVVKVTLS